MAMKMPREEFLTGPGGDAEDLDIDPIFGKDFGHIRRDILAYDPTALSSVDPDCRDITPSDVVPGYSYESVNQGVVLRDPEGNIVGGYISCDLAIESCHQGQGLGAELVLEYFARNEELPTWHLDAPAYTPMGLAAHESAWRQMATLLPGKVARLEALQPANHQTSMKRSIG